MAGRLPESRYRRNIGGVNHLSGEPNVREFEWVDALNIDIDTDGSPRQRAGSALIALVGAYKTSLVSWWRMEQTSGSRLDQAQGQNNLADTGGVGVVTGFEGTNAADFDGTNHLSIVDANQSGLDLAGKSFTIAFWYKVPAHAISRALCTRHDSGSPSLAGYQVNDVGGLIQAVVFGPGPDSLLVNATTAIDDNTFHHVAVTFEETAGSLKIYIDGTLEATDTTGNPQWTAFAQTFFIGANRVGSAEFIGALDDFSIWDIELTAANVTTLRNAGAPGGTDIFADNGLDKSWKGLFHYRPDGSSDEVIGVVAGLVVRYSAALALFTPLRFPSNFAGPMSVTKRVSFAQLFGRLYIGNGVDPNLRMEASTAEALFTQGLEDGGSVVVSGLSLQAGGNIEPAFQYTYRIVPVRQVGGGRIIVGRPTSDQPASINVSAGNQTIRIASFPASVDPGQTHWGLYRIQSTTAILAGDTTLALSSFHFVSDVLLGTTNFDDTKSQLEIVSTLDNLGIYQEHRKTPPCEYRVSSVDAAVNIFIQSGDPNNSTFLYSSSSDFPDVHLAASIAIIGRDDGDPVTGLGAFYDRWVIFKRDHTWQGIPTGEGTVFPFRFVEVHQSIGCDSHYSIANLPDSIIWKADRGFYTMRGIFGTGDFRVQNVSTRIEPDIESVSGSRLRDIVGIHFRRPKQAAYRVAWTKIGQTKNTTIFHYDYDHQTPDPENPRQRSGAWIPWEGFTVEAMAIIESASTGLDEIWVGQSDGSVIRLDTGSVDYDATDTSGKSIRSFLHTAHYDVRLGAMTKRYRELEVEGRTDNGAINLETVMDFGRGPRTNHSVDLKIVVPQPLYGTAKWGEDIWGDASAEPLVVARKRLARATGHHIQLRFGMNIRGATWVLHSWVLRFVPVQSIRTVKV